MEPVYTENRGTPQEVRVPLQKCTYEQTEELLGQLYERFDIAVHSGMSGTDQLLAMITSVQTRLDLFESGAIQVEDTKKPIFKKLRG